MSKVILINNESVKQQISIKGKNIAEEQLFEKIKSIQSLPDDIVRNFLKSKGNLSNTKFKNKFLSDAE